MLILSMKRSQLLQYLDLWQTNDIPDYQIYSIGVIFQEKDFDVRKVNILFSGKHCIIPCEISMSQFTDLDWHWLVVITLTNSSQRRSTHVLYWHTGFHIKISFRALQHQLFQVELCAQDVILLSNSLKSSKM